MGLVSEEEIRHVDALPGRRKLTVVVRPIAEEQQIFRGVGLRGATVVKHLHEATDGGCIWRAAREFVVDLLGSNDGDADRVALRAVLGGQPLGFAEEGRGREDHHVGLRKGVQVLRRHGPDGLGGGEGLRGVDQHELPEGVATGGDGERERGAVAACRHAADALRVGDVEDDHRLRGAGDDEAGGRTHRGQVAEEGEGRVVGAERAADLKADVVEEAVGGRCLVVGHGHLRRLALFAAPGAGADVFVGFGVGLVVERDRAAEQLRAVDRERDCAGARHPGVGHETERDFALFGRDARHGEGKSLR